jgi:uncharacterized repeat protein (TIGR01451 family)
MRRRRFAGVAGGVAAVVAVPALVMLLAAGSLSGQPIYAGGPFDPVRFTFPPTNQPSAPATVRLLRVKPFPPEQIPPGLKQRFPRLGESGAQVWVYQVTSGQAPAISYWHLGLCPDIKRDDILRTTEPFEGPKETLPDYHTIKFDTGYVDNEERTVAFALVGRWPIVRQPALMRAGNSTALRNLESPGCQEPTPPTTPTTPTTPTGPGTTTEPQAPTTGGSGGGPGVSDVLVAQILRTPQALSVAKLGSLRALAGGSASYRIEVRNRSKGRVRRLVVTDTPPKGASAHSTSAETTSAGGLVWRRASLAPGERWTLKVRMDVPAGARGEIVNRVRVASENAVAVQSQAPTQVVRSTVVPVTG